MDTLWRSLDPSEPSLEHGRIVPWSRLSGTVVSLTGGQPLTFRYTADITEHGYPRRAALTVEGRQTLRLERSEAGIWTINGDHASRLAGCTDVDLRLTPSTNTIPIRRLGLPVGGAAEIQAVWVDVPSLELRVARQRYTRLGEERYLYEALDSDYRNDITVNAAGVVSLYPGAFERLV